ncbi:Panacea domain-containing protein [Bacillus tequilensis]|uniref:DUF4065 domain-containing protein n=1 Tax=Bacillus tequilensis TaxID=227866 RepID=A0A6H0WHI7_9BACI|nr:type II toxin-antitoxin system antitoxin SocA domain-containing protein [Bacillus tequilensis]QIW79429.1 DUF4065 domain-containing protein [Bacillus tequilensis]
MAFHFIAIVSDFSGGRRYGWHYSSEDQLDKEYIKLFITRIKKECGHVQFGIHKLTTDDISWDSVVQMDSFFDDVIITNRIDDFIEVVSNDQQLSAYDVAKFVLAIYPVSHLKLQKLLYYIYSEFLLRTGSKLFKDPIVAFKYGPVVEDIFHRYRIHGSSQIDYKEDETFLLRTQEVAYTPSLIKIWTSEYGTAALQCIKDTLLKYGELDAFHLVDKTHQEGGPWARAYKPGQNCEITDDLIIQYHQYAT